MGRDQIFNEWQKFFIYNLKMEAFERGQLLSAREVTDKLIEYLVAEEMKNEKKLNGIKSNEAEIRKLVEDEQISRSAIIAFNGEVNKIIEQNKLELRWSVNANCNIPSDMVPLLLEYWRMLADPSASGGDLSRRLTINHVQWMSKLFPFFKDVWESKYSEEPLKRKIGTLSRLADVYARYEEITKLINPQKKDTIDTAELDRLFFVSQNLFDLVLTSRLSTLIHEETHKLVKKRNVVQTNPH